MIWGGAPSQFDVVAVSVSGGTVFNSTITESGTAADTLAALATFAPSITETGTASDSSAVVATFNPAFAEAGAAADSIAVIGTFLTTLLESGSAADVMNGAAIFGKTLTESGTAADSLVSGLTFNATLTEAGTAADSLASPSTYSNTLIESGAAADLLDANGGTIALWLPDAEPFTTWSVEAEPTSIWAVEAEPTTTWASEAVATGWQAQFANGVSWQAYGVVVDNGTVDNTTALNSLPTGVPIIGDGTGTVKFTGQWLWKSNFLFWQKSTNSLLSTISLTNASGAITQTDTSTPLTNVKVYGLNIAKPSLAALGRMFVVYINGFTLYQFNVGTNNGALHVRGSDQEFVFGTITNSASNSGGGRVGIRHYGNVPKVPTTGGKPANVWIHNNNFTSGDGVYQISLTDQGAFNNVNADDFIFEDNIGTSLTGPLILLGQADRIGSFFNASITNVIFRRMTGAGNKRSVFVQNSDNPTGVISNVLLEDLTLQSSADTTSTASFQVSGGDVSVVSNVTCNRVTIISPWETAVNFTGNVFNSSFTNGYLDAPRDNIDKAYNLRVLNGTNLTFDSNTVVSTFGGMQIGVLGNQSANITITNNTINNVADTKAAILLQDVDHASMSGNVTTPAAGTTTAKGIIYTAASGPDAGTTNSIATGNDVSAMTNPHKIIYISGQGNSATNNTGEPDHTG